MSEESDSYWDIDIPSDLSDFNSSFGSPTKEDTVKRIVDTIDESENEEVKTIVKKKKGKHFKSPRPKHIALKSDISKIKTTGKSTADV